jgi:hypothetical protein
MAENNTPAEDLALRAYLYAEAELPDAEHQAFEEQLAVDQTAREALAEVVRMNTFLTEGAPRPNPAYRERVRRRLRSTWWRRLLARRPYRGHPLFWLATGAAAALFLSLSVFRPAPEVHIIEKVIVESPAPPDVLADDGLQDAAFIWADLSSPEHVVKSHAEESRRKTRVEDRRQTRRGMNPAAEH